MKETEKGRVCSTNGGEEKCIQDIGGKTRRAHWDGQDVGGWTILKWILREIGWDAMDWVDVAQDRDQ
jgi:hypothetical protein